MGKLQEEMGGELGNVSLRKRSGGRGSLPVWEEPCSVCVVNPQVSGGGGRQGCKGYCLGMVRVGGLEATMGQVS